MTQSLLGYKIQLMKKRASLVFYIGNGVIKAGISLVGDAKNPPALLTTRLRELPYQEFPDREQLEAKVFAEFKELVNDVKYKDLVSPACKNIALEHSIVVLSSPWYLSQTKIVKIENTKPFELTEKMISDAIKTSAADYIQQQKAGISILEQHILKYTLNGYPTQSPIKKTATAAEFNVFLSFSKTETIDKFRDIVLSNFHIRSVDFCSQSLASFIATKHIMKSTPNYVLTDITSELTELLIVRAGTLAEASSFPQGKHFIVRELGKRLHTTGEVSQSLLRLYHENSIDENLKIKMTEALDAIRKDWLTPFTKLLGEMSTGSSLPSRFIIFAPRNSEWLFSNFICSEEYQQFTFSEGKFSVYQITADDLASQYQLPTGVLKDVSLAVGTIFYDKKILGEI